MIGALRELPLLSPLSVPTLLPFPPPPTCVLWLQGVAGSSEPGTHCRAGLGPAADTLPTLDAAAAEMSGGIQA